MGPARTGANRILVPAYLRAGVSTLFGWKSLLNISCQPVALNSGSIWPKNGKLKPNKILTISILDPISPGMNSDEFLNTLQKFCKIAYIET